MQKTWNVSETAAGLRHVAVDSLQTVCRVSSSFQQLVSEFFIYFFLTIKVFDIKEAAQLFTAQRTSVCSHCEEHCCVQSHSKLSVQFTIRRRCVTIYRTELWCSERDGVTFLCLWRIWSRVSVEASDSADSSRDSGIVKVSDCSRWLCAAFGARKQSAAGWKLWMEKTMSFHVFIIYCRSKESKLNWGKKLKLTLGPEWKTWRGKEMINVTRSSIFFPSSLHWGWENDCFTFNYFHCVYVCVITGSVRG